MLCSHPCGPGWGPRTPRPLKWAQQTSKTSLGPGTGHENIFGTRDLVSIPDWHESLLENLTHKWCYPKRFTSNCLTKRVKGWVRNARAIPQMQLKGLHSTLVHYFVSRLKEYLYV